MPSSPSSGKPEARPLSGSRVAGLTVTFFLVGPPLLGFLGEHFGLRYAMLVVLGSLAVTMILAPAAGAESRASVRKWPS